MLHETTKLAVHAGEDPSSPTSVQLSYFINRPEVDAASLSELIIANNWLRAGDSIHVAEIRRHTLTDADLDAAARTVIGGAA